MTGFHRYGVYMVPTGALYQAGAAWLGWDSATGARVTQPDVAGLPYPAATLTATPRKYGIHGTVKPPFRVADGTDAEGLGAALGAFCARQPPVLVPSLTLRRLGRFLALVPEAPVPALARLAAGAVQDLDAFRAPLSEAELARRRKSRLSDRQEAMLQRWGYPHVMEEFRFHITLTGSLEEAALAPVETALAGHFAPVLGQPLVIEDLALMGEDEDGMFHLLHRYALTG